MTRRKRKPTQYELVLRYIDEFGSISPLEAFRDLGITRLAARIHELRRDGYVFESESETSKNRYGSSVTYARYRLISEPEA